MVFLYCTASETSKFARLLPLLIGDLIPEDNEHWSLYLILLQITEIVMAPQTTVSLAAHVRELIAEHHSLFKTLYPDRPLTPKCHYMVHIPKWITRLAMLCFWRGWDDIHSSHPNSH